MLSRRLMMSQSIAVLGGGLISRLSHAAGPSGRKFTLDLRCGSIGVQADQREAISMAAEYGFAQFAQPAGGCCFLTDAPYSAKLAGRFNRPS